MRDDFLQPVKNEVAHRAGWCCSNPGCRQPTSGPSDSDKAVTNVGVAAHVAAASPGGPRFDSAMTVEERSSAANAIWLCQRCAKAIDDDPKRYTRVVLGDWKAEAETRARDAIERGPQPSSPETAAAAMLTRLEDIMRPLLQEQPPGGAASIQGEVADDKEASDHRVGVLQSGVVLSFRAAKYQQWRVWIDDELRLQVVFAGDDADPLRILFAINNTRQYVATCTGAEPVRLPLSLHPVAYQYRQTMQTHDSVQTQLVTAGRSDDGTAEVLERVDTRDGLSQRVTEPLLSTLAMNFMASGIEWVVSPHGGLLSARTLGDPLDSSNLGGASSQIVTGLRWMVSLPAAARYLASQLLVETPARPVREGDHWATSRDLDVMGLRVRSTGTVSVAGAVGPLICLQEEGSYEADPSALKTSLVSLLETTSDASMEADLTSPAKARYTLDWVFDTEAGWPQAMRSRTTNLGLTAQVKWATDAGTRSEVAARAAGFIATQSGWEAR